MVDDKLNKIIKIYDSDWKKEEVRVPYEAISQLVDSYSFLDK